MPPERPGNENHAPKVLARQSSLSASTPQLVSKIPQILPHERVFPIQIGSELFKLSGASLSSDAPSYFSQYFKCQISSAEAKAEDIGSSIRTLCIDRDPVTFKDISLHLQGYHVQPRDGTHFVRLFADAQFYSLPRLISQLYEESIFMSIGHKEFQIPRDLFQAPGNSPNFFSLGFAVFFSSPKDLFPGIDREGLTRPPSILPPSVPGRSAEVFDELLHLLRGYPVHIRDAAHRASLLRDAKYFNFKGLEQRLIPHCLTFNQARRRDEISLRLDDVLKSGLSVAPEATPADPLAAWVNYARPFVDEKPAELVLEIGGEATKIIFASGPEPAAAAPGMRAEFFRDAKTRIARMFEVIATKLNLPPTTQSLGLLMASGGAASQPASPGNTPLSQDLVRAVLEPDTSIVLDGQPYTGHQPSGAGSSDDNQQQQHQGAAGRGDAMSAPLHSAQDSPMSTGSSAAGGGTPLPPRKRRRVELGTPLGNGAGGAAEEWIVKTGQWRLRIEGVKNGKSSVECVLVAVKLDCLSSGHARNTQRAFLG